MAEARSEQLWVHTSQVISMLAAWMGEKISPEEITPHKRRREIEEPSLSLGPKESLDFLEKMFPDAKR